MINKIIYLSQNVRYVAILRDGQLETKVKEGTIGASGLELSLSMAPISRAIFLASA